MLKNKKGFITISLMYSFFIVFLLIMLSMLGDYYNKRELKDKQTIPEDLLVSCSQGDKLSECLFKMEYVMYKKKNSYGAYNYLSDVVSRDNAVDVGEIKGKIQSRPQPKYSCPEANEKGLYQTSDDFGTSYYYRGDVTNNYVKFANMLWRIVRINGDGSIRLILDKPVDSYLKTNFQDNSVRIMNGEEAYYTNIGIMYNEDQNTTYLTQDTTPAQYHSSIQTPNRTYEQANKDFFYGNFNNSNILTQLNTFYENVLQSSNEKLKFDSIFCSDKSIITDSEELATNACNNYSYNYRWQYWPSISSDAVCSEYIGPFSNAQWAVNFFAGYERYAISSPNLICQESLKEYDLTVDHYKGGNSDYSYDCWHAQNLNTYSAGDSDKVKYKITGDYSAFSYDPKNHKPLACGFAYCNNKAKDYCTGLQTALGQFNGNGIRSEYKALQRIWNIEHGQQKATHIAQVEDNWKGGNGQLDYPIGLISMDEAIMSGVGNSDCTNDYSAISSSDSNYNNYWTATVAYGTGVNKEKENATEDEKEIYRAAITFAKKLSVNGEYNNNQEGVYYFVVNSNNQLKTAKSTYKDLYARPVININDTKNFEGTGTIIDPFIIE